MKKKISPLSSLKDVIERSKQKTQKIAPLIASAVAFTSATDGYSAVTQSTLSNVSIATIGFTNIDINGDTTNDLKFNGLGDDRVLLEGEDSNDKVVFNNFLFFCPLVYFLIDNHAPTKRVCIQRKTLTTKSTQLGLLQIKFVIDIRTQLPEQI